MARNYAALPYDYLEEMEALNDAEFGRLTRALLTYSMTGEPIALCGNERFYAKRVMAQEDRFKASYQDLSSTRSAAGKAGAEKRWQNSKAIIAIGNDGKPIANDSKNGNTKTETETNTLPSNDGKSKKRARAFVPPTVDEVREYCVKRGNRVDPQRFVDFYESKGWKVGNQPMKDWKAAVRTWETRESVQKKSAVVDIGTPGDYERDAVLRRMKGAT